MNASMHPDAPEWLATLLLGHQPFTDGAFECEWCHREGLDSTDAEDATHVAAAVWAAITERMHAACAPSRRMARNFLDALGADDD